MAALADFPKGCRNQILPIERQHILFQMPQRKLQLDSTMNKVIGWQNLPDLPLRFKQSILFQLCIQSFKTFKTFIQKPIQKLPSRKEWQNLKFLFQRTVRHLTSPEMQLLPVQVRNLQAFHTEKQPMRQNSTKSSSSYVLQVSKRSPRDQDIQNSTEVSVQGFRDTETDPETTSNADTGDSKKFQVSNFRNDLQRKGEVMLCLPIDSTQFQQFCKKLNDKELFLCRDLLEKEIYGK